jgi:hypothetical protein
VTRHRFPCRADLSVRQSRVQRLVEQSDVLLGFDGDKSPAESGENSPRSKARALFPCTRKLISATVLISDFK